jgi:predicted enzyme related to lactoylglutathione lyase
MYCEKERFMNQTLTQTRATGIDAVHVLAKDLDRAVDFYRDALGLTVARRTGTTVEFDLPDGSSFGIGSMPDFFIPGGGSMFAVPDVRVATERLKELNATIYVDCHESEGCITTWASDTESNYFALHQRK